MYMLNIWCADGKSQYQDLAGLVPKAFSNYVSLWSRMIVVRRASRRIYLKSAKTEGIPQTKLSKVSSLFQMLADPRSKFRNIDAEDCRKVDLPLMGSACVFCKRLYRAGFRG